MDFYDYLVFFLRDILVSYFKNVEGQVGRCGGFAIVTSVIVGDGKRSVPSLPCRVMVILIV